jgi:thiosulfate/3-mercaptopyruvate sulfurtransferase
MPILPFVPFAGVPTDLIVTPDWLNARLDQVRVLDVRGEVRTSEPRYHAYPERYREGHIPGAMFADWRRDFTDRAATVPVTLASPQQFAEDATRMGIGDDTVVVAYDAYRNALAGRIVWVLRSYGQAAHLLDGGLGAWQAAGLPLEPGDVRPPPADPPHSVPAVQRGLIDLARMRELVEGGELQIVDARSVKQYTGAETHAVHAGHIPGARSAPYEGLLAADGTFLPPERLRECFARAGVDLDHPIVAYCNGGVSATVVAHAVQLAGAPRPLVYDGSWNEWGGRDDTPIERDAPA